MYYMLIGLYQYSLHVVKGQKTLLLSTCMFQPKNHPKKPNKKQIVDDRFKERVLLLPLTMFLLFKNDLSNFKRSF